MPVPSDGGSTQSIDDFWRTLRRTWRSVKVRTETLRAQATAGDISAGQILDFSTLLADARLILAQASGVAGLWAYGEAQTGQTRTQLAADAATVVAAIDTVVQWISTNMPASGRWHLVLEILPTGRWAWRTFTPASTASLRTVLDTLIATID